jgi:predicted enzyme related to lactoylglutathione lyase
MSSHLSHFAINAVDVASSRAFYESVFGWSFTAWGPPGFFQIQTGTADDPGVLGAIQQRRDFGDRGPSAPVECTFSVDSVDRVAEAVRAAGGTILMERFTISGVGHLIFFGDPDGNPIGAMEYDSNAS